MASQIKLLVDVDSEIWHYATHHPTVTVYLYRNCVLIIFRLRCYRGAGSGSGGSGPDTIVRYPLDKTECQLRPLYPPHKTLLPVSSSSGLPTGHHSARCQQHQYSDCPYSLLLQRRHSASQRLTPPPMTSSRTKSTTMTSTTSLRRCCCRRHDDCSTCCRACCGGGAGRGQSVTMTTTAAAGDDVTLPRVKLRDRPDVFDGIAIDLTPASADDEVDEECRTSSTGDVDQLSCFRHHGGAIRRQSQQSLCCVDGGQLVTTCTTMTPADVTSTQKRPVVECLTCSLELLGGSSAGTTGSRSVVLASLD